MATKYDLNQSIIDGTSSNPIDPIDEQPPVSLPDPTNPEDQPQFEKMAGLKLDKIVALGGVLKRSLSREAPPVKAIQQTPVEPTPDQLKSQLGTAIKVKGLVPEPGGPSIKSQVKAVQPPIVGPTLTPEGVVAQSVVEKARIEALPVGAAKPPSEVFNYDVVKEDGDLSGVISAISKYAGITTERKTWAESESELVKKMQDSGYSSKVISDLLERKASVDPSTVRAVLVAQASSADHLLNLATKISKGTATQAEMLNATQTIAFHSTLQRSIKNYKTNVAQSLSIMRTKSSPDVSFEDAIGGFTSPSELRTWSEAFLDPTLNAKGRADLIDVAATGGIKSRLMSVYINGLLARPGTQVRNFISNALFAPMRLAEKVGAVAIGSTRKMMGLGTPDQYRASEVLAQLFSFNSAMKDGMSMASHAFRAGYSKTVLDPTKIQITKARTEIFDYNADSPMAFAVKGLNFFATLPGRSLFTADEFFKGFTYRGELAAYATRNSEEAYRAAIAKGSSAKDAEAIFHKTMEDLYENTPDDVAKGLRDLASEATFTKPLEDKFGDLQRVANEDTFTGFIVKINMPFITAPVNISLQVLERSPLAALGLLSKRIRNDLAGDSKKADMAMAKIGMGTAMASVFANHASNGSLTGGGPADKGARDALINQGWQAYSKVLNVSSLSDEQRALFSKLDTDVRFGTGDYEGKVFVSYQGMEPLGAFLAAASNYVDYVKYESDNSRINEYAVGMSYGFYAYMMDQPFVQGLNNLSDAFGDDVGPPQKDFERVLDTLSSSIVVFGGKAVVPLSGLLTTVREKVDPYRRDYKVDPSTPIVLKGMMEGMNKLMNATPGLSDNLPNKLNIFAEPLQYETDARFHMSPLRIGKGKTDEANQILIQTHANVSMPKATVTIPISKGLNPTVNLNPMQYNKLLEIANDPAGLNLKQRIIDLGGHDAFVSLPLYQQQTLLKNEFEDVFGKAREILYKNSEYSEELRDLAEREASMIEDLGRGAK
jgi:hypothetical protein